MRQDLTTILFVLDRSGSMGTIKDDAIGGFNEFVDRQEQDAGETRLSLVQFDDRYEVNYVDKPVGEVPRLNHATYQPRGSTKLLDAIGRGIDELGSRLASMPEDDRPARVVVAILTDGEENSSREFNRAQINAKITHQRDRYQWQVLFLAANQDAIAVGESIGIAAMGTMDFAPTGPGVRAAMRATAEVVSGYKMAQPTSAPLGYSTAARAAQDDMIQRGKSPDKVGKS